MFVSIIIPTYNDSARLQRCLSLLENQTYDKSCYEVLVVDNNSSEDIESLITQFSQAVYTFEPVPGAYSARNRALALAKGEILGFTDSDCAPALDWIEQGVAQIMAHPGCGFVAGRIDFSFKDPNHPTPAELYDSLHFLQQEKYVREGHFGVTANLFTTPQVFEAVGLFDSSLMSGGDRDWGKRTHAAGYQQIYAKTVKVLHPARSDIRELSSKLSRVYKGDFQARQQAKMPPLEFLVTVLQDIKPPVSYLVEILQSNDIESVRTRVSIVYIYLRIKLMKALIKLRLYFV